MPTHRRQRRSDRNASPQLSPNNIVSRRPRRLSGLTIPENFSEERPPTLNVSHGRNTVNSPRESSSRRYHHGRIKKRDLARVCFRKAIMNGRDSCRISSSVSSTLMPPPTESRITLQKIGLFPHNDLLTATTGLPTPPIAPLRTASIFVTDDGPLSEHVSDDDASGEGIETTNATMVCFGSTEEAASDPNNSELLETEPGFRESAATSRAVFDSNESERSHPRNSHHGSSESSTRDATAEGSAYSSYSNATTLNHIYPPSQVASTNRSASTFCNSNFASPIGSPGVSLWRVGEAGVLPALELGPASAHEILTWMDGFTVDHQISSLENTFLGLPGLARVASPVTSHRERGSYHQCLHCRSQGPFPIDTFHNQDGDTEPFPARILERELNIQMQDGDREMPDPRVSPPQIPSFGIFRCQICRLPGPSTAVLCQEDGRISTETESGSGYHFESAQTYSEHYFSFDDGENNDET